MPARQYSSTVKPQTLATKLDAGTTVTSMVLSTSTSGLIDTLPNSYPYTLVIDPDLDTEEIVTVTARISSTLTIARAQDGTSAVEHSGGSVVKHMMTARDLQESQNHINASSNVHGLGVGEQVAGVTSSQTFTNKTMSGANNTFTNISQSSISNLTSDLSLKAPLASPTFTGTVTVPDNTITNAQLAGSISWDKLAVSSTVSSTELGYVDGVTSSIQGQIGALNTGLSTNTPVGSIIMFGGASAPTGWLLCNGNAIPSQHTALIALVGANTPDLRGRIPLGYGATSGVSNGKPIGDKTIGTETVTLSSTQIPPHSHSGTSDSQSQSHAHGLNGKAATTEFSGAKAYTGTGGQFLDRLMVTGAAGTDWADRDHTHTFSTNSQFGNASGGTDSHNNMQPSTVVNFIIKY